MSADVADLVPTILVADDDPDLVALVARRLTRAGYQVIKAADGEQAVQMAERFLPQLAVLDVMMPKFTGIEVIGQLRANPATRNTLVILISAGSQHDVGFSGLLAGADDYIRKPFGPQELANRVQAVLARGSTAAAVESAD
jgi:two-component system alkaline phosphatase synthesis response regulator PhoP